MPLAEQERWPIKTGLVIISRKESWIWFQTHGYSWKQLN